MSAKRKSRKKTDNTLRKIINTILANPSVRSVLKIDETNKFSKTYYKSVMINLGLEPGNMKIKDMLQAIMISLPPISVIENIIDENFSLNSISNKEDRECVVLYLEKKRYNSFIIIYINMNFSNFGTTKINLVCITMLWPFFHAATCFRSYRKAIIISKFFT